LAEVFLEEFTRGEPFLTRIPFKYLTI